MSLGPLSVAFVVGVLVHNTEEAIWLPAWSRGAGKWYRPVGSVQFSVAVALLSVLLLAVGLLAYFGGPGSIGAYLFFGFAFSMAANAIVPHSVLTVGLLRYMPGTATGLALNLPLGGMLLLEAVRTGWAQAPTLVWAAPLVAVSLLALLPLLLAAGARISRAFGVSSNAA